MYSQDNVLELIELIYAAAGDPARWAKLLKRLSEVLRGTTATIHNQRLGATESSFAASWNMDPAAIDEYTAHYAPLNLWFTTRPDLHVQGTVYTSQMLCPEDVLMGSEFYNDWLEPQQMHQGAGATIFKNGQVSSIISVFRPASTQPFDEEEMALLRRLLPHLQRAFQLHNRIQGLEQKADVAADALDHLHQGVVLLDAKGRVLMVSAQARTIFGREKSLRLTRRGLEAGVSSENRRLNSMIQGALATGTGHGLHAGGVMQISRGELRRPLQVLVTPMRTKTIHLGKHLPVVAIFISDPDGKPIFDAGVLAQLFGLTPAEARLAQILATGESLRDAAGKLGVAQSTVRSQLKAIFGKTNTNRQSQLVRILAGVQIGTRSAAGPGQRLS